MQHTPTPQRRLWPLIVTAIGTAAIALATAGAAASDDDSSPSDRHLTGSVLTDES